MYSYLLVHTDQGPVATEVMPSEQFTPEKIIEFINGLPGAVDGAQLVEIESLDEPQDNVIYLDINPRPF